MILLQKHPSRDVLKKSCSENMQQIYKRTPMPKCDFNKVTLQLYWNRTSAWVFPVNLLHIFRTSFPKNTSGGVLLLLTHFILLVSQSDAFWCFRRCPFGKITFRGRPEDVPEKRPDIFRMSCYGPICNAKGCIGTGTSLGRIQDVNLTIIHKMAFYGIFAIFSDSIFISDVALPK